MLKLPPSWRRVLKDKLAKPYFHELQAFLDADRKRHGVYPPAKDVFAAFARTPFEQVRVLLLGQDPYHDDGQAHGLCLSVRPTVKPPLSLANIFKELHADVGCEIPDHGCRPPLARSPLQRPAVPRLMPKKRFGSLREAGPLRYHASQSP